MRRRTMVRVGTWLLALLFLTALVPPFSGGATSPLTLEGRVLTGDGASVVRGASLSLTVRDGTGAITHIDFTVTSTLGNFTFIVPADRWDPGWNATLQASYSVAGVEANATVTLTAAATQQVDVTLPWNRTLGFEVTVPQPLRRTPRDAIASWTVNVTNGGNDSDTAILWATSSNSSIRTVFNPGNTTDLAPGATRLLSLTTSNPGLEPGVYDVRLHWRSRWHAGEGGTVDLAWTVVPEVELSVTVEGIAWWPDPLNDGDDALLNCTVLNDGRDPAPLANVTMELTHPVDGLVLRDKVRLDVPARGSAVASFPWQAVYYEEAYVLRFKVEHPLDAGTGPDQAETSLTVGIDNTPPTVAFTSPANSTAVNGTARIVLTVTDPDTPVLHLRLRVGEGAWMELPTTSPSTYDWDTTGVDDGWYVLSAYASDRYADGAVARLHLKVENQGPNTPPDVYVQAPADGDVVAAVLRAKGIVFDENDRVDLVELRVDGGGWATADGTTRWSANLSTAGLAEGSHLLEVWAFDGIDRSAVVAIQFYVTRQAAEALEMTLEVVPATALPGDRVTVRGEVMYDNEVRVPDLDVSIQGPNDLLVFKTTDERGVFEFTVVAPSSEGRYEYRASTSDEGGLTASARAELRVLKSLDPDLTVGSITFGSERITTHRNVTVSVEVRNLGIATGNGTLQVWEGEVGQGILVLERNVTVYNLTMVAFEWAPSMAGELDLNCELVDVQPSDADPTNNRLTRSVLVVDLPDLTVASISLSTTVPYENVSVSVSVRVTNMGGLNASCTVKLYLDGDDAEDLRDDAEVEVPAYGEAYANLELVPPLTQGVHTIHVQLVNAFPEESDTENNVAVHRFQVQGPYVPPSEDGEEPVLAGLDPVILLAIMGGAVLVTLVAILFLRVE